MQLNPQQRYVFARCLNKENVDPLEFEVLDLKIVVEPINVRLDSAPGKLSAAKPGR